MTTDQSDPESQTTLLIAIIQAQDVEHAHNALAKVGLVMNRLPSSGGFLGQRNLTLLIGVPVGKEGSAIDALRKSCRQRVEFIAVPLESAPLPMPAPTPVTIGGATIFSISVDQFKEF
jgi:uncharacterized protein YaaQ